MKTVQNLVDELTKYDPTFGIVIYADIRVYKTPITGSLDYIGTIPSNIGYSSIEDYDE
jgi:hypothetical protein